MSKNIVFILGVALICLNSGCASTSQGVARAKIRFVGKNLDEFVLAHGIPYAKHELSSGEYVYLWNSGVISYTMPQTTTMSGTYTSTGYSGTAHTTGGNSMDVFCEVQIHTQADGTILDLKATKDTWGKWTTSRCAEIFK